MPALGGSNPLASSSTGPPIVLGDRNEEFQANSQRANPGFVNQPLTQSIESEKIFSARDFFPGPGNFSRIPVFWVEICAWPNLDAKSVPEALV